MQWRTYILRLSLLAAITCLAFVNAIKAQNNFDVVVYGATPGGITAAIQAVSMNKSVVLLEPSAHIGGHMSEGLGSADIDNHKEYRNSAAVGGLALKFYRELATHYGRRDAFEKMLAEHSANTTLWKGESSVIESIFDKWIKESGVKLVKNVRLVENRDAVIKKNRAIKSITVTNGKQFTGKVFIDATYEGDLLAAAGITTRTGREANAQYKETMNGIRAETKHAQFNLKVDPYIIPGNATSGLIPTIQDEPMGTPGTADQSLQAYCFRVCLTTDVNNQITFTAPKGYDRSQYEIYIRYLAAKGKLYTPKVNLPNNKTDLGAWHDLAHNLYGMNRGYPSGNYEQRAAILAQHTLFTKGLFYFLSHDTAVARLSPSLQTEWKKWGYAKDEFTDNEGFPRKFYVRDARRMVSDYVITEHTASKENNEQVEDPIAVAYWPMDVHSVRRIVKNSYAYNEGFVFAGNTWKPFGIAYRALIPKKEECTNLLTATCPSSSHIAFGAVRLEHNFMDMGQACGTAAAIAIEKEIAVQDVLYSLVKNQLIKDGMVIDALSVGLPNE